MQFGPAAQIGHFMCQLDRTYHVLTTRYCRFTVLPLYFADSGIGDISSAHRVSKEDSYVRNRFGC
jgi:hypothetical protein